MKAVERELKNKKWWTMTIFLRKHKENGFERFFWGIDLRRSVTAREHWLMKKIRSSSFREGMRLLGTKKNERKKRKTDTKKSWAHWKDGWNEIRGEIAEEDLERNNNKIPSGGNTERHVEWWVHRRYFCLRNAAVWKKKKKNSTGDCSTWLL